jgi:Tfp pilus assembly protein PilF
VLKHAKKLAPNDPRVAFHLGRALRRGDDLAGAEAELRRALTLRASYSAALFALGGTLLDAKRPDEAKTVLEQASTTGSNEDRARGYAQLGRALLALDKQADAEKAFSQAIERAPARVEVRLDIARAWLDVDVRGEAAKKDAANKASAVMATGTDLAPDLADVWTVVGRVREAQDDNAAAEDAYARAIQLDPKNDFVRRKLLRLALEGRHYAKARAQAQALLADEPNNPEHHFLFGLVAARRTIDP